MENFLRTFAVYLFLLVLFRLSGKRTLSDISTLDFILLLIISEATQNALIGEDYSVVTAITVILTLVSLDLLMAIIKRKFRFIEKITEDNPLVLVDNGKMLEDRMKKSQVTVHDIMHSARQLQGLARMDQIKYAILESSGGISIIPYEQDFEEILDRKLEQAITKAMEQPKEKSE